MRQRTRRCARPFCPASPTAAPGRSSMGSARRGCTLARASRASSPLVTPGVDDRNAALPRRYPALQWLPAWTGCPGRSGRLHHDDVLDPAPRTSKLGIRRPAHRLPGGALSRPAETGRVEYVHVAVACRWALRVLGIHAGNPSSARRSRPREHWSHAQLVLQRTPPFSRASSSSESNCSHSAHVGAFQRCGDFARQPFTTSAAAWCRRHGPPTGRWRSSARPLRPWRHRARAGPGFAPSAAIGRSLPSFTWASAMFIRRRPSPSGLSSSAAMSSCRWDSRCSRYPACRACAAAPW